MNKGDDDDDDDDNNNNNNKLGPLSSLHDFCLNICSSFFAVKIQTLLSLIYSSSSFSLSPFSECGWQMAVPPL